MIRLRPIAHRERAIRYFFNPQSGDSHSDEPGVWIGAGTSSVDRSTGQTVAKAEFAAMLDGFHPDTDTPLFQRNHPSRRMGWDLVVAAPKSVSITINCLNPRWSDPIRRSFSDACDQAFRFVETFASTRNSHLCIPTGNLIANRFVHHNSRDESPHSHAHFIIFNCTLNIPSRTFGALHDRPSLFQTYPSADVVFKSALRENLQSYDIPTRETDFGPEIAAVPQSLIQRHSPGLHRVKAELKVNPPPVNVPFDYWCDLINNRTRPPKKPPAEQRDLFTSITAKDRASITAKLRKASSKPQDEAALVVEDVVKVQSNPAPSALVRGRKPLPHRVKQPNDAQKVRSTANHLARALPYPHARNAKSVARTAVAWLQANPKTPVRVFLRGVRDFLRNPNRIPRRREPEVAAAAERRRTRAYFHRIHQLVFDDKRKASKQVRTGPTSRRTSIPAPPSPI